MWCSFETRPLILRLYCYGELVERHTPQYAEMAAKLFPTFDPERARRIVVGRIESIQTSCGYGVPYFEYRGERKTLVEWSRATHEKGALEDDIAANAKRVEEKFPLQRPPAM